MKNLLKINLILENCERVSVPIQSIGDFTIKGISMEIIKQSKKEIKKVFNIENFAISIHRSYDSNDENCINFDFQAGRQDSQINRLCKYNDIVHIELVFNDGETETYKVAWDDSDWQENSYQQAYQNKFGDIYISIDANKILSDYFTGEEMNDDVVVESYWNSRL